MADDKIIEVSHLCKSFIRTVKDDKKVELKKIEETVVIGDNTISSGIVRKETKQSSNYKKTKWQKLVTKKEEFLAVDNISFTASPGQIYGILGPNGAGKTTLLRMLGGILTPTSGTLSVKGFDYTIHKELAKRQIGYLSGNTKLYGRLSPRELFKVFGELYGMQKDEIEEATQHVIELMNMESFADNRIEHLSTGQMQRTSIGRCLIHSPEVYIFDEPTLGLDVLSSQDIIEFMKQEKEKGKIVLYSTHYMEEAETLCDEILMLHEGKVIAQGTPQVLKKEVGVTNIRDVFIHLARGEEA